MIRKTFQILLVGILVTAFFQSESAFGDANPTVSITSPTPGAVAKGKLSISAQFAADPSGTAKISAIGISIANAPSGYTNELLLGNYTGNSGTLGSTSVDAYWSSGYFGGSSATFTVDTTSWPAGTYSIAITVLDSNERATTSTPVALVIPKLVGIQLSVSSSSGDTRQLDAKINGITSLAGGLLTLESSENKGGPYTSIGSFLTSATGFKLTSNIPSGTWVRASLQGSSSLQDTKSAPILMLQVLTIKCSLPSTAKLKVKIVGKCTFDSSVSNVSVSLNVNSGLGWHSLGVGTASGRTLPISLSGKMIGTLKVQVVSQGSSQSYQSFSSNILTIKIKK